MFTKEKLKKWIYALQSGIFSLESERKIIPQEDVLGLAQSTYQISALQELKHTLEKLYTTMTKED